MREELDSPITLDELQLAIHSPQPGIMLGPDGLPAELYKTYFEDLPPSFHTNVVETLQGLRLPESEAIIVVLPKPRKVFTPSYRLILLLNAVKTLLIA